MMLLKAKSHIITATKGLPMLPISWVKASCVSWMPLEADTSTPLTRMMKAVHEHTTNVSVNTPNACIKPCFTGWLTVATAAALGALPSPASLLKRPRLMPCMTVTPSTPPAAWLNPKAFSTIVSSTLGKDVMFHTTTPTAIRR